MSDVIENDSPASAEPTHLVGGVNFTTWPELKWSRGSSCVALLRARLVEWHASAPVFVDAVLRDDAHSIDFVARVPKGIPKHEWSLDFGDAIHNLRSAFDALAWGMAHLRDRQPTHPKSVAFPVCTHQRQWEKALGGWVGEIEPELQERLKLVQPFNHTPAGGVSFLSLLHELDIQDKHREMLTVSVNLNAIELGGSFENEGDNSSNTPRVELRPSVEFADGAVLGTLHAGAPVRQVGQMILRPAMRVQLTYREQTYDVMPLLQQMVTETRRYLDILLFGLATQIGDADEDWSPMNVEMPPS